MTDREKLIKLLHLVPTRNGYVDIPDIADFLIANGVMVQKHGRWVMKETLIRSPYAKNTYCSECTYETGRASNYCPDCGAKMDLE